MLQKSGGAGQDVVGLSGDGSPTSGEIFCVIVTGPPGSQVAVSGVISAPGQSPVPLGDSGEPGEYCFQIPAGYGGGVVGLNVTLLPASNPPVRSPSKIFLIGTS